MNLATALASMSFDTPEGVFVSILALAVVSSLIVAGIATGRAKRYVPMARRKGTAENERVRKRMAEERERMRSARSAPPRLAAKTPGFGSDPLSAKRDGADPVSLEARMGEDSDDRSPDQGRRLWPSVATLVLILLFFVVAGFAALEGFLPPEMVVSPAILLILFFTGLFAIEFLPFRKLKYGLYAALPVTILIVLGFFVDLLRVWPVLLAVFGLGAVLLIVWNTRRETSPEALIAWRKRILSSRKPGEKTARILGSSNEVRLKEKPPDSVERGYQLRQRGMYFKNP